MIFSDPRYLTLCSCCICSKLAVGDAPSAQSHIAVLVDPLSETAQRWSTILAVNPRIAIFRTACADHSLSGPLNFSPISILNSISILRNTLRYEDTISVAKFFLNDH